MRRNLWILFSIIVILTALAVFIDMPHGRMAISVTVMEAGIDPEIVKDVNAIYSSFRAR